MRLTVHVKDAQKQTTEVKTKDGVKKITRLMTTLSFSGVEEKKSASEIHQLIFIINFDILLINYSTTSKVFDTSEVYKVTNQLC